MATIINRRCCVQCDNGGTGSLEDAILPPDDEDLLAYTAARDRYWDLGELAARAEALDILKTIARRGRFLPAQS